LNFIPLLVYMWGVEGVTPSLPLPPLIFPYLQTLIHGFLWWWAFSWLIFSLKSHLQSPFLLLHSAIIVLQDAKDSIDEEDPRPTSSTWSYIIKAWKFLVTLMFDFDVDVCIFNLWRYILVFFYSLIILSFSSC